MVLKQTTRKIILAEVLSLLNEPQERKGNFSLLSTELFRVSMELIKQNDYSFSKRYHLHIFKLLHICGHFLTVNNRCYGRYYVKKPSTTVYIP